MPKRKRGRPQKGKKVSKKKTDQNETATELALPEPQPSTSTSASAVALPEPQPSTSKSQPVSTESPTKGRTKMIAKYDPNNVPPYHRRQMIIEPTYEDYKRWSNELKLTATKARAMKLERLAKHCLLRTDATPEETTKGTLVFAKGDGSVYWPACILPPFRDNEEDSTKSEETTRKKRKKKKKPRVLADIGEPSPADDEALDFLKAVCLFYMEDNFRVDCLERSRLIPLSQVHFPEQYNFVRELNELEKVDKNKSNKKSNKKWKPTPAYNKALDLMTKFVNVEPELRRAHAIEIAKTFKEERRVRLLATREKREARANRQGSPGSSCSGSPKPKRKRARVARPRVADTPRPSYSYSLRNVPNDGLEIEDSIFDLSYLPAIDRWNYAALASASETETEGESEWEGVAVRVKKPKRINKSRWAQRPKTGEGLKAWVADIFNTKEKKFNFESASLRCAECKETIQTEDLVNCHDYPFHKGCLMAFDVVADGVSKLTYKCEDCALLRCFVCKTVGDEEITKCRLCDLRFHRDCLKKWPQCQVIGSKGSITCPLHFCHTCKLEQKIMNKMRDYRLTKQQSHRCLYCMTAYHKGCCLPAGVGSTIMGGQFIVCLKHANESQAPKKQKKGRGLGCFTCDKKIKKAGDVLECSICPIMYHEKCSGYSKEDGEAGITFEQFKENFCCEGCRWGNAPLYGQVVLYRQPGSVFWPAIVGFPQAFAARNVTKPGTATVLYCGTREQYFDAAETMDLFQSFAITHLDLLRKFKIYSEKEAVATAFEEAKYLMEVSEAYRDSLLPKPEPLYKKIEHNVYKNMPKEAAKKTTKRLDMEACLCGADKGDVCLDDSSCHNREMLFECNDKNCKAKERCKNRMFTEKRDNIEKDLEYFLTDKGWGVKTKSDIPNGKFVLEYVGEMITKEEAAFRNARKLEDDPLYFMEVSSNMIIDAEYYGNLSRLMNHSCEPNCWVQVWTSGLGKPVAGIFASRDIQAGEELTFNYKYNTIGICMTCYCGSSKCKKYIGDGSRLTARLVLEGKLNPKNLEKDAVDWDEVCFKCKLGGTLLMCEAGSCHKAYHLACVGLKKVPGTSTKWSCPDHKSASTNTKRKSIKRKCEPVSIDKKSVPAKKAKNVEAANPPDPEVKTVVEAPRQPLPLPAVEKQVVALVSEKIDSIHEGKKTTRVTRCQKEKPEVTVPPPSKVSGKSRAKSKSKDIEVAPRADEVPKTPSKRITRMSVGSLKIYRENKDPTTGTRPAPISPRRVPSPRKNLLELREPPSGY